MLDISNLLSTPLDTSKKYENNPQIIISHKQQKIDHHKHNNPGYLCIETEDHLPSLFIVVNGFRLQSRFEENLFQMVIDKPFIVCTHSVEPIRGLNFQWLPLESTINLISSRPESITSAFQDKDSEYVETYEYLQPTTPIISSSQTHIYSHTSQASPTSTTTIYHLSVEHASMVNSGCLVVFRPVSTVHHCNILHQRNIIMMNKFCGNDGQQQRHHPKHSTDEPSTGITSQHTNENNANSGSVDGNLVKVSGNTKKKEFLKRQKAIPLPYYITPPISTAHTNIIEDAITYFLSHLTSDPLITRYATSFYPIFDRCCYVDQIFHHNQSMWSSIASTDQTPQCGQLLPVQHVQLLDMLKLLQESKSNIQSDMITKAITGIIDIDHSSDLADHATREDIASSRNCLKINAFPKQLSRPVYDQLMDRMQSDKVSLFSSIVSSAGIPTEPSAQQIKDGTSSDLVSYLSTHVNSSTVLDDFELHPHSYTHLLSVCVLFNSVICFSLFKRRDWMDPAIYQRNNPQIRMANPLHRQHIIYSHPSGAHSPTDPVQDATTTSFQSPPPTETALQLQQHDYLLNSKVDTVISRAYYKLSEAFHWIDKNEGLFDVPTGDHANSSGHISSSSRVPWGWWRTQATPSPQQESGNTSDSVPTQGHSAPLAPYQHIGIDVGASPGGWSLCLAEKGLRVMAVDPGRILCGHPNIVHIPSRIESDECQTLLRRHMHGDDDDTASQNHHQHGASIVVCDMNLDIIKAITLLNESLISRNHVKPGSLLVLTLKSFSRASIPQEITTAKSHLEKIGYHHINSTWLLSNRKERTIVAVYK